MEAGNAGNWINQRNQSRLTDGLSVQATMHKPHPQTEEPFNCEPSLLQQSVKLTRAEIRRIFAATASLQTYVEGGRVAMIVQDQVAAADHLSSDAFQCRDAQLVLGITEEAEGCN